MPGGPATDPDGPRDVAGVAWRPAKPSLRPLRLVVAWIVSAASVYAAGGIVPGVSLDDPGGAFLVAALIAVINAFLPPLIAALRLPFTLVAGFLLVLFADAGALMLTDELFPEVLRIDSFADALLMSLVMAAVSIVLQAITGTNDDDEYTLRVIRRIAQRQGGGRPTDTAGIVFLEIDGLALPILRSAMRDGSAPNMARWIAEGGYHLAEWETDLSSQTGASQAGILLGSNEGIPAFRWVEKESATLMSCSAPADCAEIERRHATGRGLLVDGGASRGNLLSGEADETILTVSRMEAEKRANPGYRAFLANGFNVTRALVLFVWEVLLEWTAAIRAIRRDVRPRGHRGGIYPLLRGAMCVIVRDLIVFGVLTDMMRGRPAVYATFSSYDEVAHHSGLQRADTMEALRKLDQQFGRIERARRYAARPYEIVVLSDHGQTQGATFKQRNGYGLDELVERSLSRGEVADFAGGDEQSAMVGHAISEATGRKRGEAAQERRLGSRGRGAGVREPGAGLPDGGAAATHPRGDRRAPPEPDPGAARAPARRLAAGALSRARRPCPGRRRRATTSPTVTSRERIRSARSRRTPAQHLLRTDGFEHVADIMVGSFYDPELDEGCAFEELISFHGGIGGPQTQAVHPLPGRARDPRRADRRRRRRASPARWLAACARGRELANRAMTGSGAETTIAR